MSEQKVVFKFAGGTHRNLEKACKLRLAGSTATFGNVGGDGGGGPPDLACQSVKLILRKVRCGFVNGQG